MDQRQQRKLRNRSIVLTSVLAKKRMELTADDNMPVEQLDDTSLAAPNDVPMDAAVASNEEPTEIVLNRELKDLFGVSTLPKNSAFAAAKILRSQTMLFGEPSGSCANNMVELTEIAKSADRFGVSHRATAAIATAVLVDFGLITEDDQHLIIDHHKVFRAREKLRNQQMQSLTFDDIEALYFDGKKDMTKVFKNNTIRLQEEDHISFVQQPKSYFIGHKTVERGNADAICNAIETILKDKEIPTRSIKAIGCYGTSTNTGDKGGVIRKLELRWNRPLQWLVCMLHMIELQLRALLTKCAITSTSPRELSGPIGKRLASCQNMPSVEFEPIGFEYNTEDLDAMSGSLSSDQRYMLDICKAISNSEVTPQLARRLPGPINQARWLTVANRILRLYVSEQNPSQNLRLLATYIIKVYAPMHFEIKKNSSIVYGPIHIARIISLSKYLPKLYFDRVKESISRNAFFAHPENVMLALLNDNNEEVRHKSWNIILKTRNARRNADSQTLRIFVVPKLNFDCTDYKDLVVIREADPPLLQNITVTEDNIGFLASKRLLDHNFGTYLAKIPVHTQAVERCVKLVSEASKVVCGEVRRDGWIANTIASRNIMPQFNTKTDFKFSSTFEQNLKI